MDTDELIAVARKNCCRLCLAPDSECVPIFSTFAADKEPISLKIQACVNIKVTQLDRLSSRICHACISYLNSWQSFKNRCIASYIKQQSWLDKTPSSGKLSKRPSLSRSSSQQVNQNLNDDHGDKISETDESERQHHTDGDDDEEIMKIDIDPTQFLAKEDDYGDDDGEENHNGDPQILSSLGLTHINAVNPYGVLSAELSGQSDLNNHDSENDSSNLNQTTSPSNKKPDISAFINNMVEVPSNLPSCSICKLSFSTRANARRHERNIHGRIFNSLSFGRRSGNGSRSIIKKEHLTPEMMGIFDYTKPEKYRHLLTEQKIHFIRKNEFFLQQYQTLSCNCCLKTHPTYKNFMAHMRKKYPSLARNLCFKCIKQFPTKALFVSHLKKRCCINLYQLYLADDTISKDGPMIISPEKMGAKDLLTNKVYECKLCSKTSRIKSEFRAHVNEEHADYHKKDVQPGRCGFCNLDIEDAAERKRHFSNMECIATLKCVTCEEKFETHQMFVEHVYKTHLPQQMVVEDIGFEDDENNITIKSEKLDNVGEHENGVDNKSLETPQSKDLNNVKRSMQYVDSRSPQNCKICGQHYNNYNNVLRHMESKHPDQLPETYKCSHCTKGFCRMTLLRDHLLEQHGIRVPKYSRKDTIAAASGLSFGSMINTSSTNNNVNILSQIECRICSEKYPTVEKWIEHQATLHAHFFCCQCNFQNKNIDEFKKHIEAHPNLINSSHQASSSILHEGNLLNRFDYAAGNDIKSENQRKSIDNDKFQPPLKKIKTEVDYKECHVCHAVFSSNVGLANHIRTHNAQLRLSGAANSAGVSKQQQIAIKKAAARQLMQLSSTNSSTVGDLFRRVRCRLCQRRFSSKKTYRRHMLIDHQINNVQFIKCTICKAEFTHEKGLKLHMLRQHDKILTMVSSDGDLSAAVVNAKNMESLVSVPLPIQSSLVTASTEGDNCDDDSKVFSSELQLKIHKNTVHNIASGSEETNSRDAIENQQYEDCNYWFQCRYCPAHFDTNKKLAIHTNSHDEYDSNDYSCKDCGNVYSGRKSLWVHRYKKHPIVPDPSVCTLCNKTFFDRGMLEFHMKNYSHNFQKQKYINNQTNDSTNNIVPEIKTEREDVDGEDVSMDQHSQLEGTDIPEVRCTMCNIKFTDLDLFTKHMNVHEQELYTDNPLAAMFDTGPEDPNKFYETRLGENGEYMCDICPKTFPALTAFKVHRNWHFRSDSKQVVADPNTTFRGLTKKKKDPATSVKCQLCGSLFISNNNLRRHIMELHKREISNGEVPSIHIEKYLECKKCEMKFRFKEEWIDHKLEHVKSATSDSTYEWGCEICGKIVSRKERLTQHVKAHLKDDENLLQQYRTNGGYKGSKSSNSAIKKQTNDESNMSSSQDSSSNDSNASDKQISENSNSTKQREIIAHVTSDGPVIMRPHSDDDDDDDDDSDEEIAESEDDSDDDEHKTGDDDHDEKQQSSDESEDDYDETSSLTQNELPPQQLQKFYSCDLCHVHFESAKELQSHVTSHFLNGPPSVTDESKEKKSDNYNNYEENDDEYDDDDNENNDDNEIPNQKITKTEY